MCGRTELPTKLGKENKHLKQHLTNDMMPLHLSAQTSGSGTAGLSMACPTGGGWSLDETRSPTAGNVSCMVGGLSVRTPTD